MPLLYSRRTVVFNAVLEVIAAVLLLPFYHRKPSSAVRKFLLVEPFGMGDVLSLSVMLDPLKTAIPDADVRVLTKSGNEQIYEADPRISRTYAVPIPWSRMPGRKRGSVAEWAEIWRTCRDIAKWCPDIGLDSRSEVRSQILMVLSGCRKRIGFRNYLNTNISVYGWLLTDIIEKPPVLHRYLMNRLLLEQGLMLASEPIEFPSFKPVIPAERITTGSIQVLIHIGARWKYRQWPEECWIALGRKMVDGGLCPAIIGDTGEELTVKHIAESIGGTISICADMSRLIGLVKGSDLLICLDSGPMHLAQTLGVPCIALFGPGDFELWHPQGKKDQTLFHRLPCNPCLQKRCIRPDDNCMSKITVEEVFKAVLMALERKSERVNS